MAEIEKYLDIEKEDNGDFNGPTRSRRGATMAGALEFNLADFKYEETEENQLEEFEIEFNKANQDLYSSRTSLNMLKNYRRNSLRKRLDDFKVTHSDQEETDYLDESDNELEIEMKLEETKKKTRKRGSFLTDRASAYGGQSPVRSRNITGTTFSPFEKKSKVIQEDNEEQRKLDFPTTHEKGSKAHDKGKLLRAGSITKMPNTFEEDEKFKRSQTQNDFSAIKLRVVQPDGGDGSPMTRKTSIDEIANTKDTGEDMQESIELPVRISIQRIKRSSKGNSMNENSVESEDTSRKNVIVGFDSMVSNLDEGSPRIKTHQIKLNFNEGEYNIRNAVYPRIDEVRKVYDSEKFEISDKRGTTQIFEDFNEIDGLVKELKEKEQTMKNNKLKAFLTRKKPEKISKLWKKVLKKVAQAKYLSLLGATTSFMADRNRPKESREVHVIGRGAGSKMIHPPGIGKPEQITT